ncbi:hypothetical protein DIPPA_01169 [Diplonema papillatum]|nr:hypothetical protein DIPPA_01169 [Diplonema papillatum]
MCTTTGVFIAHEEGSAWEVFPALRDLSVKCLAVNQHEELVAAGLSTGSTLVYYVPQDSRLAWRSFAALQGSDTGEVSSLSFVPYDHNKHSTFIVSGHASGDINLWLAKPTPHASTLLGTWKMASSASADLWVPVSFAWHKATSSLIAASDVGTVSIYNMRNCLVPSSVLQRWMSPGCDPILPEVVAQWKARSEGAKLVTMAGGVVAIAGETASFWSVFGADYGSLDQHATEAYLTAFADELHPAADDDARLLANVQPPAFTPKLQAIRCLVLIRLRRGPRCRLSLPNSLIETVSVFAKAPGRRSVTFYAGPSARMLPAARRQSCKKKTSSGTAAGRAATPDASPRTSRASVLGLARSLQSGSQACSFASAGRLRAKGLVKEPAVGIPAPRLVAAAAAAGSLFSPRAAAAAHTAVAAAVCARPQAFAAHPLAAPAPEARRRGAASSSSGSSSSGGGGGGSSSDEALQRTLREYHLPLSEPWDDGCDGDRAERQSAHDAGSLADQQEPSPRSPRAAPAVGETWTPANADKRQRRATLDTISLADEKVHAANRARVSGQQEAAPRSVDETWPPMAADKRQRRATLDATSQDTENVRAENLARGSGQQEAAPRSPGAGAAVGESWPPTDAGKRQRRATLDAISLADEKVHAANRARVSDQQEASPRSPRAAPAVGETWTPANADKRQRRATLDTISLADEKVHAANRARVSGQQEASPRSPRAGPAVGETSAPMDADKRQRRATLAATSRDAENVRAANRAHVSGQQEPSPRSVDETWALVDADKRKRRATLDTISPATEKVHAASRAHVSGPQEASPRSSRAESAAYETWAMMDADKRQRRATLDTISLATENVHAANRGHVSGQQEVSPRSPGAEPTAYERWARVNADKPQRRATLDTISPATEMVYAANRAHVSGQQDASPRNSRAEPTAYETWALVNADKPQRRATLDALSPATEMVYAANRAHVSGQQEASPRNPGAGPAAYETWVDADRRQRRATLDAISLAADMAYIETCRQSARDAGILRRLSEGARPPETGRSTSLVLPADGGAGAVRKRRATVGAFTAADSPWAQSDRRSSSPGGGNGGIRDERAMEPVASPRDNPWKRSDRGALSPSGGSGGTRGERAMERMASPRENPWKRSDRSASSPSGGNGGIRDEHAMGRIASPRDNPWKRSDRSASSPNGGIRDEHAMGGIASPRDNPWKRSDRRASSPNGGICDEHVIEHMASPRENPWKRSNRRASSPDGWNRDERGASPRDAPRQKRGWSASAAADPFGSPPPPHRRGVPRTLPAGSLREPPDAGELFSPKSGRGSATSMSPRGSAFDAARGDRRPSGAAELSTAVTRVPLWVASRKRSPSIVAAAAAVGQRPCLVRAVSVGQSDADAFCIKGTLRDLQTESQRALRGQSADAIVGIKETLREFQTESQCDLHTESQQVQRGQSADAICVEETLRDLQTESQQALRGQNADAATALASANRQTSPPDNPADAEPRPARARVGSNGRPQSRDHGATPPAASATGGQRPPAAGTDRVDGAAGHMDSSSRRVPVDRRLSARPPEGNNATKSGGGEEGSTPGAGNRPEKSSRLLPPVPAGAAEGCAESNGGGGKGPPPAAAAGRGTPPEKSDRLAPRPAEDAEGCGVDRLAAGALLLTRPLEGIEKNEKKSGLSLEQGLLGGGGDAVRRAKPASPGLALCRGGFPAALRERSPSVSVVVAKRKSFRAATWADAVALSAGVAVIAVRAKHLGGTWLVAGGVVACKETGVVRACYGETRLENPTPDKLPLPSLIFGRTPPPKTGQAAAAAAAAHRRLRHRVLAVPESAKPEPRGQAAVGLPPGPAAEEREPEARPCDLGDALRYSASAAGTLQPPAYWLRRNGSRRRGGRGAIRLRPQKGKGAALSEKLTHIKASKGQSLQKS